MLKRYENGVCYVFRATDAVVVVGAWFSAYFLRFHSGIIPVTKGTPSLESYAALAPLVAAVWLGVFSALRIYESRRMLGRLQAVQRLLRAHGVALMVFIALTYFVESSHYSRMVILQFAAVSAFALVVFRLCLLTGLRAVRSRGFNLRHLVAIGEGRVLETVIRRLQDYPEFGLRVRGVVTPETSERQTVGGVPVLGHFSQVVDIVRNTQVDEVLLALPPSQSHELDALLRTLKDETVDIRVVPDINQYVALRCEVEDFDGVPIVRLNDTPLVGVGAWAKRATDIALAVTGGVLIAPLFLLIACLIRLTSPGPVFYVQERMGLDGRSFPMLKFRSMKVNAEAESGPRWATAVDDRRTVLGTFLRKTSLDELPQLWNVIRGDMSLVGPRPERPIFVSNFRTQIPNYMLRHKVRSGITGWAQVNGWRGDTSLERRIECDLFYIRNWSYFWDLKILVMTFYKGFVNKNAY